MIIEIITGDIFESGAFALVNPVNCAGLGNKGVALEFKKRFPSNQKKYEIACKAGAMSIGKLLADYPMVKPPIIINFPTKEHWRNRSRIEFIAAGLIRLRLCIQRNEIKSIAIPALGCESGDLEWTQVRDLTIGMLRDLPARVMLYAPFDR